MKKKKFSLTDRIRSFKFAINGLRTLVVEEHNARIHLVAAVVAIIMSWLLEITSSEWLWVMLAIALVFISEMINTALEAICDEITEEIRPGIKKAKDLAAGSVLVSALFALGVAFFVFVL